MLLHLLVACGPDPADGAGAPGADTGADTETDSGTDSADTGARPLPGVPNAGDMAETVSVEIPQYARVGGVGDLDGDGMDEVVLTTSWGALYVARVDAHAGTATVGLVDDVDVLGHRAWHVGNGQLAASEDQTQADPVTSTVQIAPDGDDWTSMKNPLDWELQWAMPAGDLDGDGVTDVLLLVMGEGSEELVVVQGPLGAPLADRVIARVEAWSETRPAGGDGIVSTGDVDGDGADDLFALDAEAGALRIVFGPLRPRTSGTLAELADTTIPLGESVVSSHLGLVDDLDGDGTRELAVPTGSGILLYDGLAPGMSEAVPEHVVPMEWPVLAQGPTRALAASSEGEARWWTTPPARGAWRPDAAIAGSAVFGRFGGPEAVDVALISDRALAAAPGWDARPGDDLDRDGWGAAEDCDDADPARRPEAPEAGDGVDDDCDGLVDETDPLAPAETAAWTGDRNDDLGGDVVAWDDGDGVALVVAVRAGHPWLVDPGAGSTAPLEVFAGGVDAFDAGGDLDGDGVADLLFVESTHSTQQVAVLFGPRDGATATVSSAGLDYVDQLAPVGDLDGDGLDEAFASGTTYVDGSWPPSTGLLGADSSRALAAQALPGVHGEATGPVDLNGDGAHDLLVATDGAASFWLGPLTADALATRAADGTFVAPGTLRAGDVDGDGQDDLVLLTDTGAHVARGPWSAGTWDLQATASSTIAGPAGYAAADAAWVAGEWFFLSAPTADREAGRVLGFALPLSATLDEDDAALRVDGAMPRAAAGTALAVGDVDGDGIPELIVGSPGEDARLDDEGAVGAYAVP